MSVIALIAAALFGFALVLLALRWRMLPIATRIRLGAAIALCGFVAPVLVGLADRTARLPSLDHSLLVAASGTVVVAVYALFRRAQAIDNIDNTGVTPLELTTQQPEGDARKEGAMIADVNDVDGAAAVDVDTHTLDVPQTRQLFFDLQRGDSATASPDTSSWLGDEQVDTSTPEPDIVNGAAIGEVNGDAVPTIDEALQERDPGFATRTAAEAVAPQRSATVPSADDHGVATAVHHAAEQPSIELDARELDAERRIAAERDGRLCAERLALEQRTLIETLDADLVELRRRFEGLETLLGQRDLALARSEGMAQAAARLAREAASAQVDVQRELARETQARVRLQRTADRAMAIARSAIAGLPGKLSQRDHDDSAGRTSAPTGDGKERPS